MKAGPVCNGGGSRNRNGECGGGGGGEVRDASTPQVYTLIVL